jgi:hypothetical protein
MARYDENDAMSNYKAPESSSETRLRANARPVTKSKPMVKAKPKAKPMAKPVVGRAGAQTPGQRAKLGPAKSADAARAGAMSKPKASSTGGYPRPTAKKTSTSAKSVKKKSGTTDPFAKFVFGAGRALKEPFTSKPMNKGK